MFRSLGKMMGSSSKKGKSRLDDADGSGNGAGAGAVVGADEIERAQSESGGARPGSSGGRSRRTDGSNASSAAGSTYGYSDDGSLRSGSAVGLSGRAGDSNGGAYTVGGAGSNNKTAAGAVGGGGAQPAKIERKGGLSRHESPLPSPSSSAVDGAITGSESYASNGSGALPPPQQQHPAMLRRDSQNDSFASSTAPGSQQQQTILSARQLAPGSVGSAHSMSGQGGPSSMGASVGNNNNGGGGGAGEQVRTFDIDDMISRLIEAGYASKIPKPALKNAEITAVCQAAREVFLSQPTLIELSPPVKIVGDTHGQYQDLLRLFEMCGFPPHANYLFLGDYVDRGKQSLETILLLLCYKIKYPENFFLLRGNHECANVTRGELTCRILMQALSREAMCSRFTHLPVYGFYDECKRRVNIKIWKTFIDVFNTLPIAAVVASKIFCVHGGLSPSLSNMDDIRRIERPTDVPDYGLLNDLLWSDPSDTALDWEDNERGVSYCFGKAVIQQFLGQYDFDLICRAHMVVEDGYEFWNERTLVTIFSAPNYCGGASASKSSGEDECRMRSR